MKIKPNQVWYSPLLNRLFITKFRSSYLVSGMYIWFLADSMGKGFRCSATTGTFDDWDYIGKL